MAASKQKKDDPFVVTFEERGDQTSFANPMTLYR